ncbi:tetratricopeptide repeat protein [Sessilibacter corallicola]|uniref:Tetratricopeptide repeat protein n=1 Tax=Sessilibacter corallicola TaxID=2904075 RepID=A0ABQ0ACP9_9GAMM|nr:CDC27 family protein [Sessilibacter corallicola]MCE2030125.1 CDC27 family protein [Sessilibacter corallicola]
MSQLDGKLTDKAVDIKQICSDGYEQYDSGEYERALRLFYKAWLMIPSPQTDYLEAGWVLTAIGDAYFKIGKYEQAINALESCLHCDGIDGNPFVHMRLGQSLTEVGEITRARKELLKAYKTSGRALFDNEPIKYLSHITDLVG